MRDWATVSSREEMLAVPAVSNRTEWRARAVRCFLLLLLALAFAAPVPHPQAMQNLATGQWWEDVGPLSILHLCGEPYEMGLGQGAVLRHRIHQFVQDYLYGHVVLEHNASYAWLLAYARLLESRLPLDALQEIRGIADGANLPYEDVLLLNVIPELLALSGRLPPWSPSPSLFSFVWETAAPCQVPSLCSSFAAWGEATEDDQLLIGCNLEEGVHAAPYSYLVMIVRHPSRGNAFLSLGLAGTVGVWAGMNEQGIALALSSAPSADVADLGLPLPFLLRRVLQSCGDLPTAMNTLLAGNRLSGGNIVLGDGKVPEAVAIEMSAYRQAVLAADAQGGILAVTNLFVTPELALTQREVLPERELATSQTRLDRLRTLLEANYGWLGKEKSLAFLLDSITVGKDDVPATRREALVPQRILFRPGQLMMCVVQNDGRTPSPPCLDLMLDPSTSQCLKRP